MAVLGKKPASARVLNESPEPEKPALHSPPTSAAPAFLLNGTGRPAPKGGPAGSRSGVYRTRWVCGFAAAGS
ncbi:hypothetical protein AHIS1636_12100 [Arthrobacter mangrovi]|uniref:Uncharacterized protein n=1 Tax=Arthrobacter mangrovi TaxID=2966350 RepID=A0ABQ5MS12_9MICC|nr:hypothetical protein AHIS1636_12100 [Arthrobacter mangrovi]